METLRRIRKWLAGELDDARRQIFQILSAFAALLLLLSLGKALFLDQNPDPKLVAVLVPSLLAAAFLACFGKEVAGRIKKIGPIEILEAHQAVRGLDEIGSEVVKALDGFPQVSLSLEKTQLTPAQRFYFVEGDKLLTYLKLSGTEPESGAERQVFWELLFRVGRTAHTQLEWQIAIRWLEYLEKVSEGTYRSVEVSNYLAFSHLFAALQAEERGESPTAGFRKAADRLRRLAAKRELEYSGYFWLAYAQDELGLWYEAARSHLETLKRRPRLAPSRYNLAICWLKLGKSRSAYRQLQSIHPQDDQLALVTQAVASDTEMRGLVERLGDAEMKGRLAAELHRLAGLGA
jgi:tetratricopeptide (TPR) repeat protein